MKIKRGFYQQGAPLLLALTLGTALSACNLGRSSDDQQQGTPPPDPGQAPANDVIRYTGMEVSDVGQVSIRQTVAARKAADSNSTVVATLRPGTVVNRVVRYGNYSLVVWAALGGAQQGWVDNSVAFAASPITAPTIPAPRVVVDAGIDASQIGTPVFGSLGTPPAATPPPAPPPAAQSAPKATTSAAPPPTSKPGPAFTSVPKAPLKPR
jgi:hypothetical protein